MDSLGPKLIQMQGFLVCGILYLTLAHYFDHLKTTPRPLLVVLYALTFFFSNFGPKCTTFILPSQIFPVEIGTTFNGMSAAMGNLGGLVGATWVDPINEMLGIAQVIRCAYSNTHHARSLTPPPSSLSRFSDTARLRHSWASSSPRSASTASQKSARVGDECSAGAEDVGQSRGRPWGEQRSTRKASH